MSCTFHAPSLPSYLRPVLPRPQLLAPRVPLERLYHRCTTDARLRWLHLIDKGPVMAELAADHVVTQTRSVGDTPLEHPASTAANADAAVVTSSTEQIPSTDGAADQAVSRARIAPC